MVEFLEVHTTLAKFPEDETRLYGMSWEDDDRPAYDMIKMIVDDTGAEYCYSFVKPHGDLWKIKRWVAVSLN